MTEKKTADVLDFQVLKTVFYYSFAIIVCPVVSFFGSKCLIFDGILGLSSIVSHVYAAIFAVIILHIALGLFIYRAYSDTEDGTKLNKQD